MSGYLLDTNIVSHFLNAHPVDDRHMIRVPVTSIRVSSVTAAELLYGLARRPEATSLQRLVRAFLLRVDVLPFDLEAAERYAGTRAQMEQLGRTLSPLDLLIAVQALTIGAVLVTNDHAFQQVPGLIVEDWTV